MQIFKDCHTSKMKGMSTPVQAAVVSPYSSCLELIGTVMCSFNYLVCSQCQLLCSLLYTVVLTYHFTLHGLKEMKDILLVLICNLVVMFTCGHNDTIACFLYLFAHDMNDVILCSSYFQPCLFILRCQRMWGNRQYSRHATWTYVPKVILLCSWHYNTC